MQTPLQQGKLKIVGSVHGAINCIVYSTTDPDDFEFKQFIDAEQLLEFAGKYNLVIEGEVPL